MHPHGIRISNKHLQTRYRACFESYAFGFVHGRPTSFSNSHGTLAEEYVNLRSYPALDDHMRTWRPSLPAEVRKEGLAWLRQVHICPRGCVASHSSHLRQRYTKLFRENCD